MSSVINLIAPYSVLRDMSCTAPLPLARTVCAYLRIGILPQVLTLKYWFESSDACAALGGAGRTARSIWLRRG
jgi:hypothetical protein